MTAKNTLLRRMSTAAAVTSALVVGMLLGAPVASAEGAWIAPGDKILIPDQGTDELASCTAGPYVQMSDGSGAILTAGHCGATGQPVYVSRPGGRQRVGSILRSSSTEYTDVAIIPLKPSQMNVKALLTKDSGRVVSGVAPAAMLASMTKTGDATITVCTKGITTGERCGVVERSDPRGLVVRMESNHGDSGSTVWATTPKGANLVVGLLRGTMIDDPTGTVIQPIEQALQMMRVKLLRGE